MRPTYVRTSRRQIYRRRRAGAALAALVLAAAAVGAAIGIVALIRRGAAVVLRPKPTSVSLSSDPRDATISLGRLKPARGTLELSNVKPGPYRLVVLRRGFVTHIERVRLAQGKALKRTVRLQPRSLLVTVKTRPDGVRLRLSPGRGSSINGVAPMSRTVSAGPLVVTMRARGYNTIRRSVFLDAPRKFELWMDPKGLLHHCLNVFGCGPSPKQVAFSHDGRQLWVSTMGATGVEVYNWRTGRLIGRVDMGPNGAVEVIFTRDGKTVYASQMQTASVYKIDARTRKLGRRYPTHSSWTKVMVLSPDEKRLYAANWSGNNVSEINLKTGRVLRQIGTAATPRGLYVTPNGRWLFVAGFEKGDIERIDLHTGKSRKLLETGGAMRHFSADNKKGLLYADDMNKDRVFAVNVRTGKVRELARTDEKPNTMDLTPDGKVLYVSNRGENNSTSYYVPGPEWGSVLAIDTKTGKPLDAIVGGNQCTGLDVSDDGRYLAFSDFLDGRIHIYEIPPYAVLSKGRGGRYKAHFADIVK